MKLETLQAQLVTEQGKLPPVERWNPPYCGEMELTIKHDGSWHYMGSPIGRQALVRLFAGIIKKEGTNYFLVTPVEKVGIKVEDVPFLVTNWREEEGKLVFTSNQDDSFIVSEQHPVILQKDKVTGDLLPYALIRRNLFGRLHQNLFYQLVNLGTPQSLDGETHLMLKSGDYRFSLGLL